MALYLLPAVAPEVARDLNVSGTLIGSFVALAYGVAMLSALISPSLHRRHGGVRATQAVRLANELGPVQLPIALMEFPPASALSTTRRPRNDPASSPRGGRRMPPDVFLIVAHICL